jgi:hypothetical protein
MSRKDLDTSACQCLADGLTDALTNESDGTQATLMATDAGRANGQAQHQGGHLVTRDLRGFPYLICVLYGLIAPETIHMTQFLEIAIPGITWLTVSGFMIGAVQSFLYGVYAGLVLTHIYNFVDKRFGSLTDAPHH